MTINIIAAIARNNAIGNDNKLLYWLPEDMKRFKALTTGHTVIMGRKTFESLPKGALPDRRNIVLSRSDVRYPGTETFRSLTDAVSACRDDDEVYIIGGASIYRQAMAIADKLRLTEVNDTPAQADAFFPEIDKREWKVVACERHPADDRHSHQYSFIDYSRIK
ncbi:MAG: dihydrofolate reductase [Bacteroidaceae bacterium]|nr:dihydrofolate reductase [Bacteroidaceae bacterium]